MGRQALFAILCWLTLSQTYGGIQDSSIQDNESAESAPRLYRNVQHGVYASATPYSGFPVPSLLVPIKAAASQVVAVKENYVNHLTDSYGNKFVGTPQLASYQLAFPQQYVTLQKKLPEHLAQPLVAASANFQFKQANGQFFGSPYRVHNLQGPVPTPLHHFPTFGQLYGGSKVQSLAPGTVTHSQAFGNIPNAIQQSSNNNAVFSNSQLLDAHNNLANKPNKEPQIIIGTPKAQGVPAVPTIETNFQRIQEHPHSDHGEPQFQRIQDAPHSGEVKFERLQEDPHSQHSKPAPQQHSSHSHEHEEPKYQHYELPHYETKFQIIQEQPHSPQFQRIKEHHAPKQEVKFQRVQDASPTAQTQHIYGQSHKKPHYPQSNNKAKLQAAPAKQTVTYINDINGKKTIVELETKPTLPLLDLTLLEPLKFDNPLVPQVQHFLPRIHQATYQKLPEAIPAVKNYQKQYVVQKTTSYDSAEGHPKHQKEAPKKKQKKPTHPKKHDLPKKTVTYHETLDDAPEITYEINSPNTNYKETVSQKAVSYNKETQSEPVHYTYGSKSEKEPVTYSYSRTSKEPLQLMDVQYHGNGPTQLIYTFNPEEQAHEGRSHGSAPHHDDTSDKESSQESAEEEPAYHHHNAEEYKEHPAQIVHQEPRHENIKTYHNSNGNNQHHKQNEDAHHHQHHPNEGKQHHHHPNEGHEHHHHSNEGKQHHHHSNEGHQQQHHANEGKQHHHHPNEDKQQYHHQNDQKQHYRSQGEEKPHHHKHSEDKHHHQNEEIRHNPKDSVEVLDSPPKYYSEPAHTVRSENINFQPILQEYENNIRLLTAPSASIKVDPHQHVQHPKSTAEPHHREEHSEAPYHHQQSLSAPLEHSSPKPQEHAHHSSPQPEPYNVPPSHVHEKSKRIIIHEETPDEMHLLREQMREEMVKREENSEEDFEKAYKDAAIGFPAYSQKYVDTEKDIFDPESYGVPRDQADYSFEETPFQQYQEEGDEYPKESRSSYKDARDKTKQSYYSDYSVSKPESLLDRYQNKLGYYKLFKQQKPSYLQEEDNDDKKQNKKSAKLVAAPSYGFHPTHAKGHSYYGQPAPKQQLYEYDYSKGPRDNSAFASRPYQNYKSRTSFVEPQFQYGFEPLSIPKLLDSELAAMASNDSPESEKPGMRKKVYKENWYIKKTSTSAGAPAS